MALCGATWATPVQVAVWDPVQIVPAESDVTGIRLDLPYGRNRDVYGLDVGLANRVTRDFAGIQLGGVLNRAGLFGMTNDLPEAEIRAAAETHEVRELLVTGRRMLAAGTARGIQAAGGVNSAVDFKGLQLSGLANIATEVQGAQLGGIMNVCHRHLSGLQVGLFGNATAGNLTGLQVGLLGNQCRGRLNGIQGAVLFNEAAWARGLQLQAFIVGGNRADTFRGLQVSAAVIPAGANNAARQMSGMQVGLVLNRADEFRGVQIGLANYARRMTGLQIGLVNIIRESSLPFFPIVHGSF
jgi:hypothetical protein